MRPSPAAIPPRALGGAPARRHARLGGTAGVLLVLAGGVWALGRVADAAAGVAAATPGGRVAVVAALLGVVWLAVAAHEAGHLLGGRLVGFRSQLFVVGPVRVVREGGRMRVGVNRRMALAGGAALSVPPDTRALRQRLAVVVAGGPAASLACAALVAVPYAAGGGPPLLRLSLGTFAVLSAALGAVTLVPAAAGGIPSDGARLLRLARSGAVGERDAAVLALGALSTSGVRPRDWDAALLRAALSLHDGGFDEAVAQLMAYRHALDARRPGAAGDHLARALELAAAAPAAFRPVLQLEAAFFAAAHRGDAAAGRRWLDGAAASTLVEPALRLRAEAAVLAAEGRGAEAADAAQRARAALAAGLDRGSSLADADAVARVEGSAGPR